MRIKKVRMIYIETFLVLLVIVLAFTIALNVTSFKKNYVNSLVSSYAVIGNDAVRKIDYGVKYGKPLSNFYGIKDILNETKTYANDLSNIIIISSDKKILYDMENSGYSDLSDGVISKLDFSMDDGGKELKTKYIYYGDKYHCLLPIEDASGKVIGIFDMVFSDSIVNGYIGVYLTNSIYNSMKIGIVTIIIVVFLLVRMPLHMDEEASKKKIITIFISCLAVLQLGYGIMNFFIFKQAYTKVAKEFTVKTVTIINKDINYITSKGILYSELPNMNEWLDKLIENTPEIAGISILDKAESVIYATTSMNNITVLEKDRAVTMKQQLLRDENGDVASIQVLLSDKYINARIYDILLDMITVMITSFFFLVEITIALIFILDRKINLKEETKSIVEQDVNIIRHLCFLFYFAAFMSLTFIPILMKSLYTPIQGIPTNLVLGIPISVELIFAAVSTLMAGFFIEEKGWKPIFNFGMIFFLIGAFLSAMAGRAITFVIARAVFGTGYGFCIIAMQGFVNSASDLKKKNAAISSLNSGGFAGINCGCVIGAMLADRVGYSNVFYVTIIIAILTWAFAYFYMNNVKLVKSENNVIKEEKEGGLKKFLFDKSIVSFFILIVIPVAIANMFLEYFLPVFSSKNAITSADVGRIFLVNGIVIVYLGPIINSFMTKYFSTKLRLICGAALIIVSFLVFALLNNIVAAFFTAIILGVVTSFNDSAQNNYLVGSNASSHIGKGKALGVFSVVTKIGQTSGPIIFGAALSIGDTRGVIMIGGGVLVALVLFLVISKKELS